ncbi:MAG TPA: GGDEF domain-containing protein [Acidimicrobiales bacterium]
MTTDPHATATGADHADHTHTHADTDTDPEIPPELAQRIARALDRSPSTFAALIDRSLRTQWLSRSAQWVMDVDPGSRQGRESLERVHPDDVDRLLGAFKQLDEANTTQPGVPVLEPLRYRVGDEEHGWMTREALVLNLMHDPVVDALMLIVRPVGGVLDGVGHVVDLLVNNAPLEEVLAACASLVPIYLGSAVVVGRIDGTETIGVPEHSPVDAFCRDPRWWQESLEDGKVRAPFDFEGYPDDLAAAAKEAGFCSAWVIPVQEATSGEVTGCVVVWVLIEVELNIGTDHGLRQARRLAGLVIGEQRRHHALEREALTDPLTRVANRSALRRRLDAAQGPITLAFLDLDDFKAINDTHGHDAGDTVLRAVATRLGESVREDDLVVRLGGDEFAVVFADGTPEEAVEPLVARVLEAIAAPIPLEGTAAGAITVGASLGVATGPAGEVVHRADNALYASKRRKHG